MNNQTEIATESCLKPIGKLAQLIECMDHWELTAFLLAASKDTNQQTPEEQKLIIGLSNLLN